MHQTRFLAAAWLAVAFAGAAAGQNTTVVPSIANASNSRDYDINFFWGSSSGTASFARTQILYDVADVGVTQATFTAMSFRVPSNYWANFQATVTLTLDISTTAVVHDQAANTFDNNHGPNRVRVFSGNVVLPPRPSGSWPQPWETPITFARPFPFDATIGNSLVVDCAISSNTAGLSWPLEAHGFQGGSMVRIGQPSCVHSSATGNGVAYYGSEQPIPGGTLQIAYTNLPSNTSSFAINAFVVGLQSLVQPIPLAFFGPTQPGCGLLIRPDAMTTMQYTWSSSSICTSPIYNTCGQLTAPALTIPNSVAFVGMTFATQGLAVDTDPVRQQPLLYSTDAQRWTIGPGTRIPSTTLRNWGQARLPTSTYPTSQGRLVGMGTTLRFHY